MHDPDGRILKANDLGPTPVDTVAFFAGLDADPDFWTRGPGGGGGGGHWQPPSFFNLLAGFTHSLQADDLGNQKHVVTDANGQPIQAAGVVWLRTGTQLSSKYRATGGAPGNATSQTIDSSQVPPTGPWNMPMGNGGTATIHQNDVGNAAWTDHGTQAQLTYAFKGGSTASIAATMAGGGIDARQVTIPWLTGDIGPDFQLDIMALLMWALMLFAAAFFAVTVGWELAIIYLMFCALLGLIWWIATHWK